MGLTYPGKKHAISVEVRLLRLQNSEGKITVFHEIEPVHGSLCKRSVALAWQWHIWQLLDGLMGGRPIHRAIIDAHSKKSPGREIRSLPFCPGECNRSKMRACSGRAPEFNDSLYMRISCLARAPIPKAFEVTTLPLVCWPSDNTAYHAASYRTMPCNTTDTAIRRSRDHGYDMMLSDSIVLQYVA